MFLVSLISRTVLFNEHWENSLFSQCSLRSDAPPAISVSGVKHANKPTLIRSDLISFTGCGTWTGFFTHAVQERCTAAQRVSSRSQSTTLDLSRETRHPGGHATLIPMNTQPERRGSRLRREIGLLCLLTCLHRDSPCLFSKRSGLCGLDYLPTTSSLIKAHANQLVKIQAALLSKEEQRK